MFTFYNYHLEKLQKQYLPFLCKEKEVTSFYLKLNMKIHNSKISSKNKKISECSIDETIIKAG